MRVVAHPGGFRVETCADEHARFEQRETPRAGGLVRRLLGVDSFLAMFSDQVVVTWDDLVEVAPVDPWPGLRVSWRGQDNRVHERLFLADARPALYSSVEADGALMPMANAVEQFIAMVPRGVKPGWLAADDIRWSPATGMPEPAVGGPEPYRGSASEVVAFRRITDGLIDAVSVTDEQVYVRRRDGAFLTVPLAALRARLDPTIDEDGFVFGRRARLLLPPVDRCPVDAALRRALGP